MTMNDCHVEEARLGPTLKKLGWVRLGCIIHCLLRKLRANQTHSADSDHYRWSMADIETYASENSPSKCTNHLATWAWNNSEKAAILWRRWSGLQIRQIYV